MIAGSLLAVGPSRGGAALVARSLSASGTAKARAPAETSEKTIALVLFDELTLLDLVGPLQVLRGLPPPYKTVVVGEDLRPMTTDTGLALTPEKRFADVPRPFVVIVPGGPGSVASMGNEASRATSVRWRPPRRSWAPCAPAPWCWPPRASSTVAAPPRTGPTPPSSRSSGARYVRARSVEDGKFLTGGGVSSGIDMALALVARLTDAQDRVADPARPRVRPAPAPGRPRLEPRGPGGAGPPARGRHRTSTARTPGNC